MKKRVSRQHIVRTLVGASLITAATGFAGAQAQEGPLGKQLYDESCAVCHGTDGRGGGEFAQYLNVAPPSLVTLTKDNHGEYPYLKIFQIVDGRTGVRGHGTSDMPIWGNVFSREAGEMGGPYGSELLVRARVVALVDYIQSIQE